MNSIDFSKAPEGATHYDILKGNKPTWFRHTRVGIEIYLASSGWAHCFRSESELKPLPAFEPLTSCEDAPVNTLGGRHNRPRPPRDIPECAMVQQPAGSKHDSGKPLMGAVPPNALLSVAKVLTFGAQKYGRDNWQQVGNAETRYIDAALRHINAYQRGEQLDPESGENHLAHAVCGLMFILEKECKE